MEARRASLQRNAPCTKGGYCGADPVYNHMHHPWETLMAGREVISVLTTNANDSVTGNLFSAPWRRGSSSLTLLQRRGSVFLTLLQRTRALICFENVIMWVFNTLVHTIVRDSDSSSDGNWHTINRTCYTPDSFVCLSGVQCSKTVLW